MIEEAFTVYQCRQCERRFAGRLNVDGWEFSSPVGEWLESATIPCCPLDGGELIVVKDEAVMTQSGKILNVAFSDPIFVDEAMKN